MPSLKLLLGAVVLAIAGFLGLHFSDISALLIPPESSPVIEKPVVPKKHLTKGEIKTLVDIIPLANTAQNRFEVDNGHSTYTVMTSLDPKIQSALLATMDRLRRLERGKPQRIAFVAMDATTGHLVAMAGFDLADPQANPCLSSDFPAASIFKIVTAAAAVDRLGYTPDTPLYFNGNKYTLYKRQLSNKKNRYTSRISLGKAFAESVNPVFGKLGIHVLGEDHLNDYAQAFGFNQTPVAEFAFESGSFDTKDGGYHLAELGCGFNRDTLISPIFGAMMVAAILNQGTSLIPKIVETVKTQTGEVVYNAQKEHYKTAIGPESAKALITMMQKTVTIGTARKSFRGHSRDKVLSKLVLGGKTGSLYNRERTVKYDWFTGFGKEKKGSRALAVSIVVGHRKYIGTRAGTHARQMIKLFFDTPPKAPAAKLVAKENALTQNSTEDAYEHLQPAD